MSSRSTSIQPLATLLLRFNPLREPLGRKAIMIIPGIWGRDKASTLVPAITEFTELLAPSVTMKYIMALLGATATTLDGGMVRRSVVIMTGHKPAKSRW